MRFNPKAGIDTGRVQDMGGSGGGSTSSGRLPVPMPQSGGGRVGLAIMLLGLLYRFWQSRRSSGVASR